MAQDAFDLAERFQTPVFVMIGSRPRHEQLDVRRLQVSGEADRSRQDADAPRCSQRLGEWGRYKDVDGDGIPYRTIPGDGMPGVLHARLRPQRAGQVQRAAGRLRRERGPARAQVRDGAQLRPEADRRHGRTARDRPDRLRHVALGDRGEPRSAARGDGRQDVVLPPARRIRSPRSSSKFIDAHERIYVVEQNRDAQLLQLMRLELTPERITKLRSVLHYNGLPIDARSITDDVLAQEGYRSREENRARRRIVGHDGRRIAQ